MEANAAAAEKFKVEVRDYRLLTEVSYVCYSFDIEDPTEDTLSLFKLHKCSILKILEKSVKREPVRAKLCTCVGGVYNGGHTSVSSDLFTEGIRISEADCIEEKFEELLALIEEKLVGWYTRGRKIQETSRLELDVERTRHVERSYLRDGKNRGKRFQWERWDD
jgi:hypothetical protein